MNLDYFETPLGTIILNISFYDQMSAKMIENLSSKFINTENLTIEIISFDQVSSWTQESYFPVEKTQGWIIRISKKTNSVENLKIKCELINYQEDVIFEVDSGEHLDSIWIENKTHFLSIGTEDGGVLKNRAIENDFMPSRLENKLSYDIDFSFTNYLENGFETFVPELFENEHIYFHYLVALNTRKKSKDYPNENDISTNFAVDYSKRFLIKKLGIKE